jgi:hypothetical protein
LRLDHPQATYRTREGVILGIQNDSQLKHKTELEQDFTEACKQQAIFEKSLSEVRSLSYDGIYGQLPANFPMLLISQFNQLQKHLFKMYPASEIKRYFLEKMEMREPQIVQGRFTAFLPNEIDRDIDALIYIKDIFDLGEEEWPRYTLGDNGLQTHDSKMVSIRNSNNSKGKPKRHSSTRLVINLICYELKSPNLHSVLGVFKKLEEYPIDGKDEVHDKKLQALIEKLGDLFIDGDIHIQNFSVDEIRKKICFLNRDGTLGEVSYKTIKNLISKFNIEKGKHH